MLSRDVDISMPQLERANYYYMTRGESSDEWLQVGLDDDNSQFVLKDLIKTRQKLDEVPHDETGVDSHRVAGFLNMHGLIMKPFVVVEASGQRAIDKIMEIPDRGGEIQTAGAHTPLLDFTYVLRGASEIANSPGALEASLVHEELHANVPFLDISMFGRDGKPGEIGYFPRRYGFVVVRGEKKKGNYFEEGLAGLMEHKYIVEELGLTDGFTDSVEPQIINSANYTYLLPGSYLYNSSKAGWRFWHNSSHAAYGMQLLIAKDPAIFPAAIESRKSEEGLDEFTRRIGAMGYELHEGLNARPYKLDSFIEGTSHIIERLYDGNQEKALATAMDQDSGELLAA